MEQLLFNLLCIVHIVVVVVVVVHSLVVVAVDVAENTWNYINVVTLGGLGLANLMHS